MYKSKVIIGTVIIVIGLSYLTYAISGQITNELLYQHCVQIHESPNAKDRITCPHFTIPLLFFAIDLSIISIGGWMLVLGLKSISLKSFSNK